MQVFPSECKQLKGELPNSLRREICVIQPHTSQKNAHLLWVHKKRQEKRKVYNKEASCQSQNS